MVNRDPLESLPKLMPKSWSTVMPSKKANNGIDAVKGNSEQRRNFPVSVPCHGVTNERNQHAKAQKHADVLLCENEQRAENRQQSRKGKRTSVCCLQSK